MIIRELKNGAECRINNSFVVISISQLSEASNLNLIGDGLRINYIYNALPVVAQEKNLKTLNENYIRQIMNKVLKDIINDVELPGALLKITAIAIEEDMHIIATCFNATIAALLLQGIPLKTTPLACLFFHNNVYQIIIKSLQEYNNYSSIFVYEFADKTEYNHKEKTLVDNMLSIDEIITQYDGILRSFIKDKLQKYTNVICVNNFA